MSTATLTAPVVSEGVLTQKIRISSIDIVRGLVMVIMALDHTRDFYHFGALTSDPTNLQTTTPAVFFTRWITHYCAPTFVFLAGTSIFLSGERKSKKDLSLFLLTRGLWLIVLEVTVMRFAITFNLFYDITFFQVIWAIGGSMVVMAALVHLPLNAILAAGLGLVFLHNTTDGLVQPGESGYGLWAFLRQSGFLVIDPDHSIFVIYPLLPWLGIMMLGYSLGRLYAKDFPAERRRKWLTMLGIGAVGLFIALRMINVYGDPAPWSVQKNPLFTLMSFLNTTKYPVSLLYTLMTLGPVLLILRALEGMRSRALEPLTVFGRVPLFYYVLHFYLIHATAIVFFMITSGKSFSELDFHFNKGFGGLTPEAGYSLAMTYVAWIAIVVFLYPLCRWYNRYKGTHSQWWLSYL